MCSLTGNNIEVVRDIFLFIESEKKPVNKIIIPHYQQEEIDELIPILEKEGFLKGYVLENNNGIEFSITDLSEKGYKFLHLSIDDSRWNKTKKFAENEKNISIPELYGYLEQLYYQSFSEN